MAYNQYNKVLFFILNYVKKCYNNLLALHVQFSN